MVDQAQRFISVIPSTWEEEHYSLKMVQGEKQKTMSEKQSKAKMAGHN
jgi:hypothetical protein